MTTAMRTGGTLEAVLRRDRALVVGGLVVVAGLAWLSLWRMAQDMAAMDMSPMSMPDMHPWTAADVAALVVMWGVMMVAMMVPSAAPMILTFATASRRRAEARQPYVPTAVFVLGYVLVWTAFSVGAGLLQWALHVLALLSPMMASTSPVLGGLLLVAAGVYQWTPLKFACLASCRSPLSFLMTEWREGRRGALVMGLRHGAFCLGCCWLLMGLLFVAGVMNLLWVAAISAVVLAEKALPQGEWVARAGGTLLVAWGLMTLFGS